MRISPLSFVFCLLSSRRASRVPRLALFAALALGLSLPAFARYRPATPKILTQTIAQPLTSGEYKISDSLTFNNQLQIAENADVVIYFAGSNTMLKCYGGAKGTCKAAILLPPSSHLAFRSMDGAGGQRVEVWGADGGDAGNGGNGSGAWAFGNGSGGNGGNGANAPGAGIGGDGGCGAGQNANGKDGGSCGKLYVFDNIYVEAHSGNRGAAGTCGSGGSKCCANGGGGGGGSGGQGGQSPGIGGAGGGGGGGGNGHSGAGCGGGGGGGGAFGGQGGNPGTSAKHRAKGEHGKNANGMTGGDGGKGGDYYGSKGGNAGQGGAGGSIYAYAANMIYRFPSKDTGAGTNATLTTEIVTFNMQDEKLAPESDHDTYMLRTGTHVFNGYPVNPPIGLQRRFKGYYTAATNGNQIFNADGKLVKSDMGNVQATLYAQWDDGLSDLCVNGYKATRTDLSTYVPGASFASGTLTLQAKGGPYTLTGTRSDTNLTQIVVQGCTTVELKRVTFKWGPKSGHKPILRFDSSAKNAVLVLNGENLISINDDSGKSWPSAVDVESGAVVTVRSGTGEGTLKGVKSGNSAGILVKGELTWENGVLTGYTPNGAVGGGIRIEGGTFLLKGGEIAGCLAKNGGGIGMQNGTCHIEGGEVSGNEAKAYGGGVYVNGGTLLLAGMGSVSGNKTPLSGGCGGGGVCLQGGSFQMTGGTLVNNTGYDGGGLLVSSGSAVIQSGTISGNTASYGGALYTWGSLTVTGGWFEGNFASSSGLGSVLLTNGGSGRGTVRGGVFKGNAGGGSEFHRYAKSNLRIEACLTDANSFSGATFVDATGPTKVPMTGSNTWYVTGSRLTADAYGIKSGTLPFDPLTQPYVDACHVLPGDGYCYTNLTAGGVVYLPSPHRHCDCGKTDCGHVDWDQGWTPISFLPKSRAGHLVLTNDIELTETWQVPDGETWLCLNGHTIRPKDGAQFRLAVVPENAKLHLVDCRTNNPGRISSGHADKGGAFYVRKGGELEIRNVILIDNTATESGGAVYFEQSGKLTIHSGILTNNCATASGGAIWAGSGTSTDIRGGAFAYNQAGQDGGVISSQGPLTVSNGLFARNSAIHGGALALSNTSGSILGGTFANNSCETGSVAYVAYGDGFDVREGVFRDNAPDDRPLFYFANSRTAPSVTGGVYDTDQVGGLAPNFAVQTLTYTSDPTQRIVAVRGTLACDDDPVTGGISSGRFAFLPTQTCYQVANIHLATNRTLVVDEDGLFMVVESDHTHCLCGSADGTEAAHELRGWVETGVLPKRGGFYYLANDIVLTNNWSAPDNLFLCLNGHTIDCNGQYSCSVTGTLTVTDCSADQLGKVTNGKNPHGGAFNVSSNGHFRLYRGRICGNSAEWGGGVYVAEGGRFTMYGGIVEKNRAYAHDGGGVFCRGVITLYGGSIRQNTAQYIGGGVATDQCFEMFGGDISGNVTVGGHGWGGGGVGVGLCGSVFIYGGAITNNATTNLGGGIFAEDTTDVKIYGGVIYGNTERRGAVDFYRTGASRLEISGGVFAQNPTNSTGVTVAEGFAAQAVAGLENRLVVARTDTVESVEGHLYGGTYTFNPAKSEYAAAGVSVAPLAAISVRPTDPVEYVLSISPTLVVNGSFEAAAALPAVTEEADFASSGCYFWTPTNTVTLYGRESTTGQAFGTAAMDYAALLAPEGAVEQTFEVTTPGLYLLSFAFRGDEHAQLKVRAGRVGAFADCLVEPFTNGWCRARIEVTLLAGTSFVRFENVSADDLRMAVDAVSLVYEDSAAEALARGKVANGGFETGVPMPPTDGAAKLEPNGPVGGTGWTTDGDATLYGSGATNEYPMGVSEGDYALHLPAGASVSQAVVCPGSDESFVFLGSTGRIYAVSFDCATATPGRSPKVAMLLNGEQELASAYTLTNGTWTTTTTLAFVPDGSNRLAIVCADSTLSATVDNVSFVPYVRPEGELLLNGSFVFGTGLPNKTGVAYVGGTPPVKPAIWTVTGEAGIFGSRSTEMTRAGTRVGSYGLFLSDGARATQTFRVQSAGEYRLVFSYAARRAASEAGSRPVLTATVDGVPCREVRPSSNTSYDAAVAFLSLEPGEHTLSFEVAAPPEQAAVVDFASIKLRNPDATVSDVTGVVPAIRIKPVAASCRLSSWGVESVSDGGDDESCAEEDFTVGEPDDFFNLESQAAVYAHPEYRADEMIVCRDGFAVSVGGVPGETEGTILAFSMIGSRTGRRLSVALENTAGGDGLRLALFSQGQKTNLFAVSTQALREPGETVHYAVNLEDGCFGVYVNGRRMGACECLEAFEALFDGLRLGDLPEAEATGDVSTRACASFRLSDVRCYNQGLTDEQIADLAASVEGRTVSVAYYDEAENRVIRTVDQRVGAVYGIPASLTPLRPGYTFTGWTLGGTGVGEFVTAFTLANTMTDHRLYANWQSLPYRITYDFRGYPFAVNTVREIQAGATYDPPSGFVVEGAEFRGWTNAVGRTVTHETVFPSTGVYADETLYADFDASSGTVTFEPGNGEEPTSATVEVGTLLLPLAPQVSRTGYRFDGWWLSDDERMTDETGFRDFRGETWTARWFGDEQTVTWHAYGCLGDGTKTVSRSGAPFVLPDGIPVPTNGVDNLRFYGWASYDNIGTARVEIARWDYPTGTWVVNEDFSTPPEAGFRAQALWWQGVPLDAAGGSVTETYAFLYPGRAYGDFAVLPTPRRNGYTFVGWHVETAEGELVLDDTVVPDTLPTCLVAAWTPADVIVSLDANGGSNVSDHVTVKYLGPYGELPVPVRPGYALAYWTYVHEGGPLIRPDTIVSNCYDHLVVASWTNAWFAIRYELNGQELDGRGFSQRYESPWPALYTPTEEDFRKTGVAAKEFKGWLLGATGVQVSEGEIALMTVPTTLVAWLENATSTLTLDANGGVLDPTFRSVDVKVNDPIEGLKDPKRTGCEFRGWYADDGTGPVTNGMVWTRAGSSTLVARWSGTTKLTFTFDAGPGGVQTAYGYYQSEMPVPAVPVRADGARFLGWWLGNVQCYDADGKPLAGFESCPYESDQTFVAHFEETRDAFAGAYALTNGASVAVCGLMATDEPDEPAHDREGVLRATHWYAFGGTNGANVSIVFEDFSGDDWPAAAVAVYRGMSLDDLVYVAGGEEYDSHTLSLDFRLPANGTYYLAVAQDWEFAALSDYQLTISGVSAETFVSAWTNPDTMPGETAAERNANALKQDGFSDEVSVRVAPASTYAAFTSWAHVGKGKTEVLPEAINDKPNVVLASAYGLVSAPTGTLAVTSCEVAQTAAGTDGLRMTLKVTGDFASGGAKDINLLAAAIGVTGSLTVGGTYSSENLDIVIEAADVSSNEVRILVAPKATVEGVPESFFFKGVTY